MKVLPTEDQMKLQLADSSKMLAEYTADMVYGEPELIRILLELSWQDIEPWSQRASRVVSICCCKYQELFKPYVSISIKKLGQLRSEGLRRNILKIFFEKDFKLSQKDKTHLLNLCFDFLSGPYSVSVKVYSMDILYKLSLDLPEIQRELCEVIENQLPDGSSGFKIRGIKLLKKAMPNSRSDF
jgi:hypothetical protein